MSLLCRTGFHQWRPVGFNMFAFSIERCDRCGCGREFCGWGHVRYSKEQMDAALAESAALIGDGGEVGNG